MYGFIFAVHSHNLCAHMTPHFSLRGGWRTLVLGHKLALRECPGSNRMKGEYKTSRYFRNNMSIRRGNFDFIWLIQFSLLLLEKLPDAQVLDNFHFFLVCRLIVTFTRALHWSLSWTKLIQSTTPHHISLRSVLILILSPISKSSQRFFLSSWHSHQTLMCILLLSMRDTRPFHLTILELIILRGIIFAEVYCGLVVRVSGYRSRGPVRF
jgi:hypothetical protein